MTTITLESTYEEYLNELQRIRIMYRLKSTMRYLSVRDDSVHSESVAEHLFGMQVIAQYFYPLEDPNGELDRVRVGELMLFHELGEIETGDIINHRKTDEHRALEREAAKRVAKLLPTSLQNLALERLGEYEARRTPEGKFAHAIDKIEPIFELWDESTALTLFKKHSYTYENAMDVKREVTEEFPYMRKFVDAWESRAVALDIFPS